jgi:hypothetical protein
MAPLVAAGAARLAFVVHGSIAAGDRVLRDGEAWSGEDAATFKAGGEGATVWRWGWGQPRPVASSPAPAHIIRSLRASRPLPQGPLLLRGDSVAFPPGGCAYLHRHQGPGIRCLIEGGIRIDTRPLDRLRAGRRLVRERAGAGVRPGRRRSADPLHPRHGPAGGLPRQSSLEYLNAEDKASRRPEYKVFADVPLRLATGR